MISSLDELATFAQQVAAKLRGGELLLLTGDLGAGKTAFIQALAKALGITEPVTSPTFTIAGEYEVSGQGRLTKLIHLDLYRLDPPVNDPLILSFIEEATQPDRVTIVEWADRLESAPVEAWRFSFIVGQEAGTRKVTYTAPI